MVTNDLWEHLQWQHESHCQQPNNYTTFQLLGKLLSKSTLKEEETNSSLCLFSMSSLSPKWNSPTEPTLLLILFHILNTPATKNITVIKLDRVFAFKCEVWRPFPDFASLACAAIGMFHSMSWPCSYVEQHLVWFGVINSLCGVLGALKSWMDLKCSHTEINFKIGLTPSLNNLFFSLFLLWHCVSWASFLIKANILSRRLLLSLGLMSGKTRVLQQQGLTDLVGNTIENTACE